MAAAAARSVLRSATARLAASLNPRADPSPLSSSSQKALSARTFRSPVEVSSVSGGPFAVNQRKAACFSTCSKRFQRIQKNKIDLKRVTSSMGIVQGVEYDAGRTSRIALVRWEGGGRQRNCNTVEEFAPPENRLESTITTNIRGSFAFSSLPGTVDHSKKARVKDVFHSAFSSTTANGEASSFSFPRIAVAGAKPAFFVFGKREKEMGGESTFSLGEIRNWRPDSIVWTHRNKRKAAVSWHSVKGRESLGLVRADGSKTKKKTDQGFYTKADRAPLSYILATHQLKPGMMVVNWSKPPTSNLSRWNTNAS